MDHRPEHKNQKYKTSRKWREMICALEVGKGFLNSLHFLSLFLVALGCCCGTAFLVVEHRFWAAGCVSAARRFSLPHSTWNLLGPGTEPVSSLSAVGFKSTVPPGKYSGKGFLVRPAPSQSAK